MKYTKVVNVWGMEQKDIKKLQRGQWVSAGPVDADRMNMGVYCGVTPYGTIVVAWRGNMQRFGAFGSLGARSYLKTMREYGKGF